MEHTLMNKNKEIALIELDNNTNLIDKIYDIYNIDYATLSFKVATQNKSINNVKALKYRQPQSHCL